MRTKSLFMATSMLAVPVLAVPALAQQAAGGGIPEIVVTAQRQSQNVLAVPMSIQAISGEQLNNSGVRDLTDLQFTTPGYVPTTGSGFTQIYIRGIGNNIYVGADPSVATFVDDVPRIWGTMNENFVNVSRVEILKGAQGGLYGRNATGGVVNIITRQPSTDKFEGNALASYGEKNTFRAAGYVNVPVSDKIALAVAAERDSHDAYVRNTATSNPYTAAMFPAGSFLGTPAQTAAYFNSSVHPPHGLANQNFWATDEKLLLKLSDNFKITFAYDYNDKADTNGNQNVNVTPAYTQSILSFYFNGLNTITGGFVPNINAQLPAGFEQGGSGKFTTSVGDTSYTNTKDDGASATAVWNAPGFDVTSISAYRSQHTGFAAGANAGTAPDSSYTVFNHRHLFYQELRAVSTNESRFHWLGGATFLDNYFDGLTNANLLGGLIPFPTIHSTDSVKNWSIYAQAGYDLTEDLSFTVSGRYIHEKNTALFTSPVVSGNNSTQKKFLPSATLSYKLDGGNIYARWARGLKSGGINPTASPNNFTVNGVPNAIPGSTFGPEQVDTYEVGSRQSLLDHKVQLTTAVFYNDYKGAQVSAHAKPAFANTIILAIVNGGTARTYGAEGSLNWRVIDPLTLGVNAAYLNAKYKKFALLNNPVLADFDLSGQTMLNSPKLQLSFTAGLDQPVTDNLRLVGNAVVSHISRVIYQQSNIPGFLPDADGPGYWLTNLRLGVRTADDKYGFAVYANNVFNAAYYTFGNSASTGNIKTWGNPRIVGAEVSAKF